MTLLTLSADILFAKKIKFKHPKSVFEYTENVTNFLDAITSLGLNVGKITATG